MFITNDIAKLLLDSLKLSFSVFLRHERVRVLLLVGEGRAVQLGLLRDFQFRANLTLLRPPSVNINKTV